jgi:hypothetical protein
MIEDRSRPAREEAGPEGGWRVVDGERVGPIEIRPWAARILSVR